MTVKYLTSAALIAFVGGLATTSLAKPPAQPAPTPPAPSIPSTPAAKPLETKSDAAAKAAVSVVMMQTSMGDILIELNPEKAPLSVANFLSYVKKGHYDGTIFHRVMSGFMIQGGGFTADMKEKATDAPIKNEWQNGLKNKRGTIAMARKGGPGTDGVDSATCQFFINVVDNAGLDSPQRDGAAYAVFGKVISGMEVVDKIKAVKTGAKGGMGDVPLDTVTITTTRAATAEEIAKAVPLAIPAPAATPTLPPAIPVTPALAPKK